MFLWVYVAVVSLGRIHAYSPESEKSSASTLVAVDSSGGSTHLMRSQTGERVERVETGNPYGKMVKMLHSKGADEDSIVATATDVEKNGGLPAPQTLRWVIPGSATVVVGLLAAVIYRGSKRWPEVEMVQGGEEELKEWSSGHFDCLSEPAICCVSCCCPCLRWADTMDMANIVAFWPAALVFLFLMVSNFWVPAFVLINIALLTYGRQMLRKGFGMKEQTTARSLCGDCLYVSFCTPCAITQEARHVEKAAKVGHSLLESKRPVLAEAAPAALTPAPAPLAAPVAAAPVAATPRTSAAPAPAPAPAPRQEVIQSSRPSAKKEAAKPPPAAKTSESDEEF